MIIKSLVVPGVSAHSFVIVTDDNDDVKHNFSIFLRFLFLFVK